MMPEFFAFMASFHKPLHKKLPDGTRIKFQPKNEDLKRMHSFNYTVITSISCNAFLAWGVFN